MHLFRRWLWLFLAVPALLCGLLLPRDADAVTIHLTDADANASVLLHLGDRLRVQLATSPATGYRWTAKKLDASHLQQVSEMVRPMSGRADAGGTQVDVWRAIEPGHAEIAIEYGRPAQDHTIPPARRIVLSVDVVAGTLPVSSFSAEPGTSQLPLKRPDANAFDALMPVRVYHGLLPCPQCLGIDVELILYVVANAAGEADQTNAVFVERRRFKGAPGGDRTIVGSGRLSVLHGTYADPQATVYVLGAPGEETENWKVEGDQLLPLDDQMLPVVAKGRDTALHRVHDNTDLDASEP